MLAPCAPVLSEYLLSVARWWYDAYNTVSVRGPWHARTTCPPQQGLAHSTRQLPKSADLYWTVQCCTAQWSPASPSTITCLNESYNKKNSNIETAWSIQSNMSRNLIAVSSNIPGQYQNKDQNKNNNHSGIIKFQSRWQTTPSRTRPSLHLSFPSSTIPAWSIVHAPGSLFPSMH